MKQYTTPEQTAKLIKLGFERPENGVIKQLLDRSTGLWITIGEEGGYSIGELIEMLMTIKGVKISFEAMFGGRLKLIVKRLVGDKWDILYGNVSKELTDLLFDAIVKLKEGEVI